MAALLTVDGSRNKLDGAIVDSKRGIDESNKPDGTACQYTLKLDEAVSKYCAMPL